MAKRPDTSAEERREALTAWVKHLTAKGLITSQNNWCELAEASESAVRAFLTPGPRQTKSLNEATYEKLALFAGVTPDDLRRLPSFTSPHTAPDPKKFIIDAFEKAETDADRELLIKIAEKVSGHKFPRKDGQKREEE